MKLRLSYNGRFCLMLSKNYDVFLGCFPHSKFVESISEPLYFARVHFLNHLQLKKDADLHIKSTVMRKAAKEFNNFGWLFLSLIAKSKVPIETSYLPR